MYTKKNYYLLNPGRLSRKDNTIKLTPKDKLGQTGKSRYIPVEGVQALYIFGSLDANSDCYRFLAKHRIPVHFFDHYEHYSGSFQPKDYLLSGKVRIQQSVAYLNPKRRMHLAQGFVSGAIGNMLRNLKYYTSRGKDCGAQISKLQQYLQQIYEMDGIPELMGIEGNAKMIYYDAFETIIDGYEMGNRQRRPPSNEVNALLSFGNMMCYSRTLDQLYHTQLDPTVSYLHEPGTRRYSLALDVAEIFKPLIVDRLIFRLLNRRELTVKDFEQRLQGCYLKEKSSKIFIAAFDDRMKQTIKHRTLKKSVSYSHLIRLECYKISKYILELDREYKPFKIWW